MMDSPVNHERTSRLLIAAYQEGARPGGFHRKCAAVIRRAITDAGEWSEQAASDMYEVDGPSEVGVLYRTLISMIGNDESSGALFVGQGNFRLPAAPPYTECRLTVAGAAAAKRLAIKAP